MADIENKMTNGSSDFVAPDVSVPTDPRREIDIIEEEIAQRRRSWIRSHMNMIYAIVGVLVVGLIFLGIHWYNETHNPMSRMISTSAKDFGSSFDFDVTVEKNGVAVMRYGGTYAMDSGDQTVRAVYDAQYTDYQYKNVVYTEATGLQSYKGNYYNGQWTIGDCTDKVQDFFDFYDDYRHGSFDGGSFLRFAGLTSKYSSSELGRFVDMLKDRLGSNSSVSTYSTSRTDGKTSYTFDIDLDGLFRLITTDGASLFFRSTDFDRFCARYKANADIIKEAGCKMSYTANAAGYMENFSIRLDVGEEEYAVYCTMSNFATAVPNIPADFYEAAAVKPPVGE